MLLLFLLSTLNLLTFKIIFIHNNKYDILYTGKNFFFFFLYRSMIDFIFK